MGSAVESLALKRNLSCSDKVQLTSSSGFSSNLAVPGLPWGISSMPPIETPSATQPILYSNDGTRCCLIGCKEAEALFISVWQAGVHDGDITPATTNAWPASGPLYPISSTSLDSGWSLMNGLALGVSVSLVGLSPNRLHFGIVAEAGSAELGLGVGTWAADFASSFSLTALSVHHGVVSCQSKDGREGNLPAGARGCCLDSDAFNVL
ncbi:hypothetical protein Q5P01_021308 [Channa striata]|uniref:Uncharacterized protein n=1 Tax=Channa striata TaxID=64152 RepID=A0AA88LUB0_CHASR|nr:hypothetical protein Q5P01_021308 [Channa striata]